MMNKLRQFMIGRYGVDNLGKATAIAYIIISVLSLFFHSPILVVLAYALLFLFFYRCFSKKINKRVEENQKYFSFVNRFKKKQNNLKRQWDDRAVYRYYTCKHCGQTIRVPKGKGKICITCPKCHFEFIKRT
ncbi:hypothetical protein [Velocimicrobium porci]|uniref:Zn-finger containing protein n=1 Tax=Velocimicrobium porci TaxID=2606634 RepID=A0A6L5Y153_9FIRM|nr:hypothetical protein [Velocimicrobium porci]MSS64421.1 hypothetical protein [Velocimicrobium porci]